MTYVPIVTPTPTPPPSPRTRELAGLLTKVLDEYAKAHPAVTNAEVRAAIRIAQSSSGPDQARTTLVISLALGMVVAFLGFGLFYFRSAGGGEISASLPMIIAVLVMVLLIALVALKARSH
ncbi:MAG: hypothetical protein HKO65_16165 [Gemmatimonadetes bacterium]|nr:hypothetical protein [Gemmatimonadota bacterium]NNM06630.1 hypothetical protein [Gemmatimonadota bacterium]